MKIIILFIVLIMGSISGYSQEDSETSKKIIALEKAALERWNHGDVYGYLDLMAEDINYFDPSLEKRIDGIKNLKAYYEPFQGKISASSYEMINPIVQTVDSMAVLTYNLNSYEGERVYRWNSTEVYRKEKDGSWKLIHSHWSFTKPAGK